MTQITKNLDNLQKRISAACAKAGRSVNDVSILAVSKRHSVDSIGKASAAGLTRMGENYVQEALQKIPLCDPKIEWHFIGRIQSNKTRAIAENFSWVHTVSSVKIAQRLNSQRPEELPALDVCVQIDIDGNGLHGGIAAADAEHVCAAISELPRIHLRGLMTIPTPAQNQQDQQRPFRQLRELRDELAGSGYTLSTLSMGMTNDLEAAILEGSTMIRIGTALFGQRPD